MLSHIIFQFLQTGLICLTIRTRDNITITHISLLLTYFFKQLLNYTLEIMYFVYCFQSLSINRHSDVVLFKHLTYLVESNTNLKLYLLLIGSRTLFASFPLAEGKTFSPSMTILDQVLKIKVAFHI